MDDVNSQNKHQFVFYLFAQIKMPLEKQKVTWYIVDNIEGLAMENISQLLCQILVCKPSVPESHCFHICSEHLFLLNMLSWKRNKSLWKGGLKPRNILCHLCGLRRNSLSDHWLSNLTIKNIMPTLQGGYKEQKQYMESIRQKVQLITYLL